MTSSTKSCFNCKYLSTWNYSGTRLEPPDSGWECAHPNSNSFPFEEPGPDPNCPICKGSGLTDRDTGIALPINNLGLFLDAVECSCVTEDPSDEEMGVHYAKNCPGYEYKEWVED